VSPAEVVIPSAWPMSRVALRAETYTRSTRNCVEMLMRLG
jgi:hypothetical protein